MHDLRHLLEHELKDLYSGESQIISALPKMAEAASHPELRQAFETHLEQTREQARRLEQVAESLGMSYEGHECKGMKGILEEGKEILAEKSKGDPDVIDAALISAAQRVEHYEMAGYGTARTLARQLGEKEAAEVLQVILDEEGETDKLLTRLAESRVNRDAAR
ncbi:MAG TPA: ferritin-like domain-containing protein [Deinococcales bacterium]|nr:ferritin-like domain-containing protein [Deinococcales bacterium]